MSSKNIHKNATNKMTATNFTAATRFPWFETAKKVPTSNTIGNIYEIIPNKPKKKRLTVPPIVPPNPKLLINSKSETATTIHKITSRENSASRSCCFFVFLLCPEFVFLPDDDFFPVAERFLFPVAKILPPTQFL